MEVELLKKVPFFSALKERDLKKMGRLTSIHKYKKDNIILMESEKGSSLFLIHKGRVKISRVSDDGKEVILAILKEGDFFGEMSLLDGQARSANVTSIEDSELLVLKREDFLQILKTHPELTVVLLKELAQRIRKSDMQIKSLSLLDAVGRVASTIIQLAETTGVTSNDKIVISKLPSQQDIASMAGTSRETVSRTLHLFINENLITKEGNKIIIEDLKKFKSLYI
ncbi:Crp/Fnr family transcriptional regulator [candidate division KSB1 bacterium]